ncbi:unnamed protein product [Paramecium octaurelia]|uniref:Transmembrane protein n=1 Tax=Paramecium octaurelia TaxID=43137 RepID=A0A8S1TLI2_PAROT|nr:unnamed protein product [Paramecium octaurelia]
MKSVALSKIKKAIKQFDLFGVELNLNINQQEKYRSACGGIASLIMIFLLGYIFTNRFISIINKEDYTVNAVVYLQIKVQNLKSANPNYNIMNSQNFMFAIKVDDPLQSYYQNETKTSYNITIQQFIQKSYQNGTKTKELLKFYRLEKCTTDHFVAVNFLDYSYIFKQLSSYLCLPLDYELYLQGGYNSEIFFFPKLIIETCQNESDLCYSKEEIIEFNKNRSSTITLSTLIKSSLFLSNETKNTLYHYIDSDFYLQSDFTHYATSDIFFQFNKIKIDDSLLSMVTTSTEELDYWSFSLTNYRQFQKEVTEIDVLFEVNLRLDAEQQVTTKTAQRFDQFLSYLGGMLKFFSALFGFVAIQYNFLAMRISLANVLYEFNLPIKEQGRVTFSYDRLLNYIQLKINRVDELIGKLKNYAHQVVKLSNITRAWTSFSLHTRLMKQEQHDVGEHQYSKQEINEYTEKLKEMKENFLYSLIQRILDTKKQLRLGINFFTLVFYCCQCFQKVQVTRKLINQCDLMIRRDLDIVTILSKIQQIEKLKATILDQDQIYVFNYIPKPVIFVDQHYQISTDEQLQQNQLIQKINSQKRARVIKKRMKYNSQKKFAKIYKAYLKLKESKNDINNRLIQLLGPTMELIFQKYHELQEIAKSKEDLALTLPMPQKSSVRSGNLHTSDIKQDTKLNIKITQKDISDDGNIEFQGQ